MNKPTTPTRTINSRPKVGQEFFYNNRNWVSVTGVNSEPTEANNDWELVEDVLVNIESEDQSGNILTFDNIVGKIYNESSPNSNGITLDNTGAVLNGKASIYVLSSEPPTITGGNILLSFGDSFAPNQLNLFSFTSHDTGYLLEIINGQVLLEEEYLSILGRADLDTITKPETARQILDSNLMKWLKDTEVSPGKSLFQATESLHFFDNTSFAFSSINWKNPTGDRAVEVGGTVNFADKVGVTGDGSKSINLNWNPFTDAINSITDNMSALVWAEGGSGEHYLFGITNNISSQRLELGSDPTGLIFSFSVNGPQVNQVAYVSTSSLTHIYRSDSTTIGIQNAASAGTSITNSSGQTGDSEMHVLARYDVVTTSIVDQSTATIRMVWFAENLSSLSNEINTKITAHINAINNL